MGDAGEGLIDTEARIQERMEDLERERERKHGKTVHDPARQHAIESLRLARIELEQQLTATTHERRRTQIVQAIEEIERRVAAIPASS